MLDPNKQALAVYEMICSTCEDRPNSGNNIDELLRRVRAWQAANPALTILRESEPAVLLAFLNQSLEWLSAQRMELIHFRISDTIHDGIMIALQKSPRPLGGDTVLRILSEFRKATAMARMYFPLHPFLALLTRDQVREEIRGELQKLHAQYAPSATGKIDERSQKIRNRIYELMYREGDKQLDPGRGPWSQIVFDELQQTEPITQAAWFGLLEHCKSLQQTAPSGKWKKRAGDLMTALEEAKAVSMMRKWLALGPTPGQPSEARSPIEDSEYQKGIVWCVALGRDRESAVTIADFGFACLRKIRMLGAVSQKVGFACVQALGAMECDEAVSQLARMRAKVRYSVALRLIEKSLQAAARRRGVSTEDLEDLCIERFALSDEGVCEIGVGDAKATLQLIQDGSVAVVWRGADGKVVKAAPAHVRKAHANEVRAVGARAKEIEQAHFAQRARLESSLTRPRNLAVGHWRQYFIDHPLLGNLGRRLIWVFSNAQGWEESGIWFEGRILSAAEKFIDISAAEKIRLWHPLASSEAELQRWRERIFAGQIRQPFPQAFREYYQVTQGERETRLYSNRFAGRIMRQHQFASLCRERGWNYRLMGAHFDGFNVPTKELAAWNMHATFHVDLLPDRNDSLKDSALAEESSMGISLFLGSDQVRFYRDRREIELDEVPALVFSEVMRDVDLFTTVCSIGEDESWSDQGDRSQGTLSGGSDPVEITTMIALRADILGRVVPHTKIADRCTLGDNYLEVRGQLGTYRVVLWWGGAKRITNPESPWLNIPRTDLKNVQLDLNAIPIELDHRTELILRKAHVLADDWKINSPELVRQLMPE
jgi:hypothetical protein